MKFKYEGLMMKNPESVFRKGVSVFVSWSLLLFLIFNPVPIASAQQPQDQCEKLLNEAEEKYYNGLFEESIALVKQCLEEGTLNPELGARAYKQLSLSFLAQEYRDQAKESIRKLLQSHPDYKPNPEQEGEEFTELVDKVREEIEKETIKEEKQEEEKTPEAASEKPGGSKKWLWIGGGALVAGGIVAAVVLSGKDDGNGGVFPFPPARP
jgi:tetratricopeptide (TPR) repeat protein